MSLDAGTGKRRPLDEDGDGERDREQENQNTQVFEISDQVGNCKSDGSYPASVPCSGIKL